MSTAQTVGDIRDAVAAVNDPEFPGVTIEDLGILRDVRVGADGTVVDLVPTFLGCPALGVIADDVAAAARAAGARAVSVRFVNDPPWSPDLITPAGRRLLAEEFTVAVTGPAFVTCPLCGSVTVEERSPFGPTACRAIAYCESCRNPLEVMRG
ncbi:MAG TPA: 1,2-phenylacetyl-CoA epoxidase subunit PaaD [Acidimicrobiia bacterium]|jgi:ring-1,2-phenylacetyl-CoA epoxidase subunit PaaD